MRRQLGTLLLACALFTGCYTTRRFPAVPVLARLASPSGFRIIQPAGADSPASACVALQAEVEVTALRGDTLHFARVTVLRQPAGAEPCAHPGTGLVALAEHPDLRTERKTFHSVLTWAAILVAIPLAITAIFIIGYGSSLGT